MLTLIRRSAVSAGAVTVVLSSVMGAAAAPRASAAGPAAAAPARAQAADPANCTPTARGGNLCVLNPTANLALNVLGNSPVTAAHSIFWNSSNAQAAIASASGSQVRAAAIGGVGGFATAGGGAFTPTPDTGLSPEADPFANVPEPAPAPPYATQAEACAAPGTSLTASGSGTTTASPGVYTVINAKDTATLMLAPGVYTIKSYLKIEGSATLIGQGVTLYFCSTAGQGVNGGIAFQVDTARTVTLTAPGGPTDFAIFFARNANPVAGAVYLSKGQIQITGRVYAASGLLTMSAHDQYNPANPAGVTIYGDVVVDRAMIHSAGILNIREGLAPAVALLVQSAIATTPTNHVAVDEPTHGAMTLVGTNPATPPTGTVNFRYYPTAAACAAALLAGAPGSGGTDVGTVPVPGSLFAVSPTASFSAPGTYYWASFYSGDGNNSPAVSACQPLYVF